MLGMSMLDSQIQQRAHAWVMGCEYIPLIPLGRSKISGRMV